MARPIPPPDPGFYDLFVSYSTQDNLPPQGFFHHYFSFLFPIGFSWGGHWS